MHSEHEAHYAYEPDIGHHIIDMKLFDLNLSAQFQVNPWLGVEVAAPYRLVETDASFLGKNLQPLPDSASDIHHRDEVIHGFADLQVLGTTQISSLKQILNTHLSLRFGLSFPTALTRPNPFALGDAGLKHQHIFFGTGTYDPIIGFAFRSSLKGFELIGWGQVKSSLYENNQGYRGPTIFAGAFGVKANFGLENISFVLQQEFQKETPAKWRQVTGEIQNARNSGRSDLIATAGIFWKTSSTVSLYALGKVPYWTKAQGGQMDIPGYASLGVQWENPIDFRETSQTTNEAVHEHSHRPSVYNGPGDIEDVALGGASFELANATVANKLTIIDFWAEWCEPCHVIDKLLREIAEHDNVVAVRRAEVPNFESPVFLQHLKGTSGLPTVWIIDKSGKMIKQLSGASPHDVAKELNALLQCGKTHEVPTHRH